MLALEVHGDGTAASKLRQPRHVVRTLSRRALWQKVLSTGPTTTNEISESVMVRGSRVLISNSLDPWFIWAG